MVKKIRDWNITCERFVAFLDIMGFKDRLQRDGHEKVKELLESFHPIIKDIQILAKRSLTLKDKDTSGFCIIPVFFSDSIVLISNGDSFSSALSMLDITEKVFQKAISLHIPIKGAIAYGGFTADLEKSIHFGQPLVDAYELQQEILFYGIALHHSAEKRIIAIDNPTHALLELVHEKEPSLTIDPLNIPETIFENSYIVKYPTPLRNGKVTHYIVDWIGSIEPYDDRKIMKQISYFYNIVSGNPRIYVDNTLNFTSWYLEKRKARVKGV
jgi:hypothetical protein